MGTCCAPAETEFHQTDKTNLRRDRRDLSPEIGSRTCGDCLGLSHMQRNSHTLAFTSVISLCMCVPVYMRSCIRASVHVCAHARAHTHSTQGKVKSQRTTSSSLFHRAHRQRSKDNLQLSSTFLMRQTLVSTPCALRNQTDTVGPSTGLSASLRTNLLTSAGAQCPSTQHAGSSVPLQLEIQSRKRPLELRFDPLLCGAPPGGRYCHCCRVFFFLG